MNSEFRRAIYKRKMLFNKYKKKYKRKTNGEIKENKEIVLQNEGNNQLNYISLKGVVGC